MALKGAVPCHPGEDLVQGGPKNLKSALDRVCCNPAALKQRMQTLETMGYNTPPPDAFAVWRIVPEEYNPKDLNGEMGGKLIECQPSPPMIAVDKSCDVWVAQDRVPHIMRVRNSSFEKTQHEVLFDKDQKLKITGPAIVTSPDVSVPCSDSAHLALTAQRYALVTGCDLVLPLGRGRLLCAHRSGDGPARNLPDRPPGLDQVRAVHSHGVLHASEQAHCVAKVFVDHGRGH